MKIAVCDDDKVTREQIATLIGKQACDVEITMFDAGENMLASDEYFDIYFLDVEMNDVSGIDVAKNIRRNQENKGVDKSIIIFATGHREYMEEAFDVNAFHYLVKPIDEKKFFSVFKRAIKEMMMREKTEKLSVIIKCNGMQRKIFLKDIYYIESNNKKVVFHTKDGKHEAYGKMDDWESELGETFYRSHRGFLVNMEKITAYSTDTINIVNGDSVILAKKKYTDFVKTYMGYAKSGGVVNV